MTWLDFLVVLVLFGVLLAYCAYMEKHVIGGSDSDLNDLVDRFEKESSRGASK